MRKALCLLAVVLVGGCSDDSGGDAGTGGGVVPTGGMAGVLPPTGGMAGMTTTGGVAGPPPVVGGTGGTPPAAVAGFDAPGCEVADTTGDLHAGAMSILSNLGETMEDSMGAQVPQELPCGFSSCHQGNGKAGLVLQDVPDLTAALVNVQSCETASVPLVDPSGGDAGLLNSWIWIKMVGSVDSQSSIIANPAWGMGGNCGQLPSIPYGVRMPQGSTSVLAEETLAPIRNWICGGAPGPM